MMKKKWKWKEYKASKLFLTCLDNLGWLIEQVFHAFLFNIRSHSLEVITQRRKAKLNIILPRVNDFDVQQKMTWNIHILLYTHSTKQNQCTWMLSNHSKIQWQHLYFFLNSFPTYSTPTRKTNYFNIFFLKSLNRDKLLVNQ